MMISEDRKRGIVQAFQASFKRENADDIAQFSLRELRDADAMLADRDLNAGYRIALRNRIRELEEGQKLRQESHIRVVGYIVSFCLGVLATVVAVWLA